MSKRDETGLFSAHDPAIEFVERGDAAIGVGVERDLCDLGRALRGEGGRLHFRRSLAPRPGSGSGSQRGDGLWVSLPRRLRRAGRHSRRDGLLHTAVPVDETATRHEARVGVDLGDLDLERLADALHELVQLQRLQEGDEALGIEALERKLLRRHGQGRVAVERDELLRHHRLLGVVEHLARGRADHPREVAGADEGAAEGVVATEALQGLGIDGGLALLVERQV